MKRKSEEENFWNRHVTAIRNPGYRQYILDTGHLIAVSYTHLAMCLKKDEYAQIIDLPCEDERVRRYLKGETLDVDDLTERKAKGWYLVCVDAVSYTHLQMWRRYF